MRKRTAVIAAVAVVAVGGGVAYAAWSSTGSGSGKVGSTTSVDSQISPVDGAGGLYPGGSTAFSVTITNPNSYKVTVASIAAGSSAAVNGCDLGTVTSAAVTNAGEIAAGGSADFVLTATMKIDASDACKGQTFTLPLTAQLVSAAG